MKNDLVFKTGRAKQALGWFVFLGAGVALVALVNAMFTHFDTQTQADLWSGVVIGLILVCLMVAGIAIQTIRWSIEGETLVLQSMFSKKTIPVSGLAGYGKLIIMVSIFPLAHLNLYDGDLKPVGQLPVNLKDMDRAEAWLARRLRYVVNDGSAALPRLRFSDTPKI